MGYYLGADKDTGGGTGKAWIRVVPKDGLVEWGITGADSGKLYVGDAAQGGVTNLKLMSAGLGTRQTATWIRPGMRAVFLVTPVYAGNEAPKIAQLEVDPTGDEQHTGEAPEYKPPAAAGATPPAAAGVPLWGWLGAGALLLFVLRKKEAAL